jgi:XTP/dITP diphosphohydrolase
MNNLVLGTRNNGKIKSFKSFLSPYFNLQDLKKFSWENFTEAEESGKTFAENSIIKAQNYGDFLKLPILSEDAGIIIEAIPEMFGVRSRREIIAKNDQEWLKKFL